jgi:endonuclease YncB( thermonuclease family)
MDWEKIDNSVPLFSLDGHKCEAKCVNVYDGDTIKAVFPYMGKVFRWNCRIGGIDTPEVSRASEEEKILGKVSRDVARGLLLGKMVSLSCKKFDKYGRLLVDVELEDGADYASKMISTGHAKPYNGGTKVPWVVSK